MRGGILLGGRGKEPDEPFKAPERPEPTPDQVRAMDLVEKLRVHLLDQLDGVFGTEEDGKFPELTPALLKGVGIGYSRESCAHLGVLKVLVEHRPYLTDPSRGCATCHKYERLQRVVGSFTSSAWPCPTLEGALAPYRVLVEAYPGALG